MERSLILKPDRFYFPAILLLLIISSYLYGQSTEDLFESVFGQSSGTEQIISVPLYINSNYVDDLTIHLKGDQVSIETLPLLSLLENRVEPSLIDRLDHLSDSSADTLTPRDLDNAGLRTEFNSKDLSLQMEIPPDMAREQAVDLQKSNEGVAGDLITPAPFSAYLNMYSSLGLSFDGSGGTDDIKTPVNLGFDSAMNFHGWVLEGNIQLNYKDSFAVSDWNARIIRDIPGMNLRLKGGTVTYPVSRLQGYIPLDGISIARNFSLNPYDSFQPQGSRAIILTAPSDVEIFVNGRRLRKVSLPAGRYNLENMQLDSGSNNIEVKIHEITGNEKSLFFEQPFNINLLKSGITDFSGTMGIDEGTAALCLSGYYRRGLSDTVTAGVNVQSDFTMINGGISLTLGTNAGNFSLDGSVSWNGSPDWAGSLLYRYSNSRFPARNNWSLSVLYRGMSYTGLSSESVSLTYPLRLSLYYGQILPGEINGGISINRNFDAGWSGGNTEAALHLSRQFGKGVLMNLSASEIFEDGGGASFSAGLTITVNRQKKNETLSSGAAWPGSGPEINWQKSSSSRLPGYSINGGISGLPAAETDNPFAFNLGAEYRNYHYTGTINHSSSFLGTDGLSQHNSSLGFSSALVFADSTLAITRPVNDSFIIIRPDGNLNDFTIGINPESSGYGALLKGGRKAVLPDLNSYRNDYVILEPIDLPIGYDMGESLFTFVPTYKSGAVIKTGSSAVSYAGGILSDAEGNPLALTAIAVHRDGDNDKEEKTFFTDRKGYFEIYGLSEGEWIIELPGNRSVHAGFTIPPDYRGFFNLRNIQMRK